VKVKEVRSGLVLPDGRMAPQSKIWRTTFANALEKGATPEQAERLADATYEGWKKR
jgi:hypothetical protein